MNLQDRISQNTELLRSLLAADSTNYVDWRPGDFPELKRCAGVYHFFYKNCEQIESLYVGKGGFGKSKDWSLYSRLMQHFQPSQPYTVLGKASRGLNISPDETKEHFRVNGLKVQWLTLGNMNDNNIESRLLSFERFAIAILQPKYTKY